MPSGNHNTALPQEVSFKLFGHQRAINQREGVWNTPTRMSSSFMRRLPKNRVSVLSEEDAIDIAHAVVADLLQSGDLNSGMSQTIQECAATSLKYAYDTALVATSDMNISDRIQKPLRSLSTSYTYLWGEYIAPKMLAALKGMTIGKELYADQRHISDQYSLWRCNMEDLLEDILASLCSLGPRLNEGEMIYGGEDNCIFVRILNASVPISADRQIKLRDYIWSTADTANWRVRIAYEVLWMHLLAISGPYDETRDWAVACLDKAAG